jgi:geranylgeranyl transferase type-2 subunit beta
MPSPSYLEALTLRLATGAAELSHPRRESHGGFFSAAQRADGGFAGREGESDLYYTGFALRALALLGKLEGDRAAAAARFLSSRLVGQAPIVDFLSLIYGATLLEWSAGIDIFADRAATWRQAVADALEKFRRDDGGYAKGPEGIASSTYHTFLVLICLELLGVPPTRPSEMVDFILSQRREDGGFVEIRPMRKSGTNPTAAAIGALRALGGLTDEVRDGAVDFLADMQNDEGGLRANTRIPIADLLSTFTGLWTLGDLSALDQIDTSAAARYAASLEQPGGGFLGAVWDQGVDVEYSFYGLGTLSLLANRGNTH